MIEYIKAQKEANEAVINNAFTVAEYLHFMACSLVLLSQQ